MVESDQAKNQGTEQATVRIDLGLTARMRSCKPPGITIGHLWSTAARLFLALPEDDRLEHGDPSE